MAEARREGTIQGYGKGLENEGMDFTRVWQGARKAGTGLYKGMEGGYIRVWKRARMA